MAWLGIIALVGLVVVMGDIVRERIMSRRARRRAAAGLPPKVWSLQRRLLTFGGGFGAVVAVLVVLFLMRSTGSSQNSKALENVNTLPPVTASTSTSSTTSTTLDPGRPPAQVRVEVINASGAANAATTKGDALKALGYQIVPPANGTTQTGTTVQCKPGFEKEAATLAKNVGTGTTVAPSFPSPAPTGSTNADCVVVLGK